VPGGVVSIEPLVSCRARPDGVLLRSGDDSSDDHMSDADAADIARLRGSWSASSKGEAAVAALLFGVVSSLVSESRGESCASCCCCCCEGAVEDGGAASTVCESSVVADDGALVSEAVGSDSIATGAASSVVGVESGAPVGVASDNGAAVVVVSLAAASV